MKNEEEPENCQKRKRQHPDKIPRIRFLTSNSQNFPVLPTQQRIIKIRSIIWQVNRSYKNIQKLKIPCVHRFCQYFSILILFFCYFSQFLRFCCAEKNVRQFQIIQISQTRLIFHDFFRFI